MLIAHAHNEDASVDAYQPLLIFPNSRYGNYKSSVVLDRRSDTRPTHRPRIRDVVQRRRFADARYAEHRSAGRQYFLRQFRDRFDGRGLPYKRFRFEPFGYERGHDHFFWQ